MKYAWIERHKRDWPVSVQCEVLGVSPSGYHQHFRRRASPGARKRVSNDAPLVHIKAIHAEVKGEYGWPRVWKELLTRGIRVGKVRVLRMMWCRRHPAPGLIFHSDRGSQYCSADFQAALNALLDEPQGRLLG